MLRYNGKIIILNDHIFLLLQIIFDRQFRKVVLLVMQKYGKDCVIIGGRSKPFVDRWPYMGIFAVWVDIGLCH